MNRILASVGAGAWWVIPLCVALAFLGWESDWGRAWRRQPPPAEPVVAQPVAVAALPDYAIPGGLAARGETTSRTLFNPTRRPAPPVVAEAPKPTLKRGQFTLTGTLIVDGRSSAVLREVAGGKSRRVLQGESINGMLVAEVKPDRVRLALGNESEDLTLKVMTNPKPTPAPMPSTPTAAAPSVAPPAVTAAPGAAPSDAAPQPGVVDLAARRRAAREAAAARAAAAAAAANPPVAAEPAAVGTAPAPSPDSWAAVEQRYRERAARQR